ncbi:unnamed protein product [Litomosoides sigmodontis]|uniref:Uncharacterized protein n=1 Tax=Litomosoides sigmodontis TaxID=42156 RepID=A0A3P6U703_LITSI|nr:unnamed protein product [Litomosoides sigmodontis]
MHRGYVGFGSDNDGRKYVENGWQNSWRSGQNDGNSGWNRKQTGNDNWDMSGKRKWFWENGGSHGWGQWGSDLSGDLSDSIPELYTTWGNSNTDSWKNHGGGEGWQKWEADDEGAGSGSRQYGGWRSWKSGSGGGRWKSWKNGGADGGGNLMSWKIGGSDSQPPGFRPIGYDVDATIGRVDVPSSRPVKSEWNVEYNYGRNYKHSEGKEWGTGYNNLYNGGDTLRMSEYDGGKAESVTPVRSSGSARETSNGLIDKQLPFNDRKKQFEKRIGNGATKYWYNWPIKNLTWPNWTVKENPYRRQLIPWWNSNTRYQHVQEAEKVGTFMLPVQHRFFWPRSIGWTGDLGPFGEVPTPSWYTNKCCSI